MHTQTLVHVFFVFAQLTPSNCIFHIGVNFETRLEGLYGGCSNFILFFFNEKYDELQ